MAKNHLWQKCTWLLRAYPGFLIIGAMKSGTSSLYKHLSLHPQLQATSTKELHFFDGGIDPAIDNFAKGIAWYKMQFPWASTRLAFEASPLYLFNPLAAGRIFAHLPKVKLICLLRNPSERAVSHYFHNKRRGMESLPLLDALLAEDHRLADIIAAQDYKNAQFIQHSYKQRGVYYPQIQRFRQFFPSEQLLVLPSEEFFAASYATAQKVCEFVGVNANFAKQNLPPHNIGTNKTPIPQQVSNYLDNYFAPHNEKLYQYLDRDFGW